MQKKYIKICNIIFELSIDLKIEEAFLNRVVFNEYNMNLTAVSINCCRKEKILYTNPEFVDRQEPIISDDVFYREIYDLGIFKYNRKTKMLEVEYEDTESYPFNSYEVTVDTIFQFMYLIMMDFDIIPLHASVLKYNDSAVMIFGNSGAGKSTLQLSLLNMGVEYFADDIVFVDDKLNMYCSGENIVAYTKATSDIIKESFCIHIDDEFEKVSHKKFVRFDNRKQKQITLKPLIIIFPRIRDVKSYQINKLYKKDAYISLIEMSISKQFSANLKKLYLSRLKRLVDCSTSYEFCRGKSFDKDNYIKSCSKILEICSILENEFGRKIEHD